jgi:hypothetical protein
MNIQFLFENGKGSVVDEYGRPEPMDYIVDEEMKYTTNTSKYLASKDLIRLGVLSKNSIDQHDLQGCLTIQVAGFSNGCIPHHSVRPWSLRDG